MTTWSIVTGAAGGLGREVATRLSSAGAAVLWFVHPDEQRVALPLGPNDRLVALDLADDGLVSALETLAITYPDVSCIVHCAGLGYYAPFGEISDADALAVMRVNFLAPILITRTWIHSLEARRGSIVLLSSVVAGSRSAFYGLYSAAKSALEHFGRSLQAESPRVAIAIVRPGAMRTQFHARSRVPFPVRNALDPSEAARRVVRTIGQRGFHYLRVWERVVPLAHRLRDLAQVLWLPRHSGASIPPGQAIVTGASKGIGAALRETMQRDGVPTIGWSRVGVSGVDAVDAVDVRNWRTVPIGSARGMVLNAGVNHAARFADATAVQLCEMMQTNAESTVMLALRFLRQSAGDRTAWLLIVSSLAAQVGYPGSATYGATKELVSRFALALRGRTVVRVAVVWPGAVDTEQAQRASPRGTDAATRMPAPEFAAGLWRSFACGDDLLYGRTRWRFIAALGITFPSLMMRGMRRLMLPEGAQGQ